MLYSRIGNGTVGDLAEVPDKVGSVGSGLWQWLGVDAAYPVGACRQAWVLYTADTTEGYSSRGWRDWWQSTSWGSTTLPYLLRAGNP